jgi:hypothetical protein
MRRSNFLPDPLPERIIKCMMPKLDLDNPMFSIGVQIITKDNHGLAVIPHKAVVFATGTESNPEQLIFDVPPSLARLIAGRLTEMADAAEAGSQDAAMAAAENRRR